MPTVLAIETATTSLGVALASGDGLRARTEIAPSRRHAESLTAAVGFLSGQAGIPLSSLDAVAVDVGPGLFTGLRVGVATAASLAYALGIGVVPVRATDAVAHAAHAPHARPAGRPVAAVLDARRGELYAAVPGLIEPFVAAPAVVLERLLAPGVELLLCGEGAALLDPLLADRPGSEGGDRLRPGPRRPPDPLAVAELALVHLAEAVAPEAVAPLYLRAPDAQITWDTRHGAAADRVPDRVPDREPVVSREGA